METKQLPTFPSPAAKGYPSSTYLWLREAFFVLPWKLPIPAPPRVLSRASEYWLPERFWSIVNLTILHMMGVPWLFSSLRIARCHCCSSLSIARCHCCGSHRCCGAGWGTSVCRAKKKNHLVNQILPGLSWKSSHFIWESHSESQTFWHITLSKFTDVYKKNASNQIHIYIFGYWHSFFKC